VPSSGQVSNSWFLRPVTLFIILLRLFTCFQKEGAVFEVLPPSLDRFPSKLGIALNFSHCIKRRTMVIQEANESIFVFTLIVPSCQS
jgi:hypothetical protein